MCAGSMFFRPFIITVKSHIMIFLESVDQFSIIVSIVIVIHTKKRCCHDFRLLTLAIHRVVIAKIEIFSLGIVIAYWIYEKAELTNSMDETPIV